METMSTDCEEKMDQKTTLTRNEAFVLLGAAGFNIPEVSSVNNIVDRIPVERLISVGDKQDVIVYLDQLEHRGNCKVKMNIMTACECFPDYLCSMYIEQTPYKPTSLRLTRSGSKLNLTLYSSDDKWRSNCGNVHCVEIEDPDLLEKFSSAISFLDQELEGSDWAVDLVSDKDQTWYAVDLNVLPR